MAPGDAVALAEWKALSAAGNAAFRRGDDGPARELYLLALEEAERLWSAGREAAPALHTVACHNLAELERRAGNYAASQELLDRALGRLAAAARDESLAFSVRTRAVDNLKHALAEIVAFTPPDALAESIACATEAWLYLRRHEAYSLPV